jgi:hypothetical protein
MQTAVPLTAIRSVLPFASRRRMSPSEITGLFRRSMMLRRSATRYWKGLDPPVSENDENVGAVIRDDRVQVCGGAPQTTSVASLDVGEGIF